jgi:ribosomal protein S18 acetylase RimI-like enzyme
MRLSTLAVNPVYWRRGHATRLVRFCTELADLDRAVMVSLEVSGTSNRRLIACRVCLLRPKVQKSW